MGDEFTTIAGWWLSHPSEKYQLIGMIIPNIRKNAKCSKPPTRLDWKSMDKCGYIMINPLDTIVIFFEFFVDCDWKIVIDWQDFVQEKR